MISRCCWNELPDNDGHIAPANSVADQLKRDKGNLLDRLLADIRLTCGFSGGRVYFGEATIAKLTSLLLQLSKEDSLLPVIAHSAIWLRS
jgi:hypothetical protein